MNLKNILATITTLCSLNFVNPQPIKAENFYINSGIGFFIGSGDTIKQLYGPMPLYEVGVGLESKTGFRIGLDFSMSSKQAPLPGPENSTLIKDPISKWNAYQIALEVSKLFGEKNHPRPYIGAKVNYSKLEESLNLTFNQKEYFSVAGSDVFGLDAFAGLNIPFTKNFSFDIKLGYDYSKADFYIEKTNCDTAIPHSGVDVGGYSGTIGLNFIF